MKFEELADGGFISEVTDEHIRYTVGAFKLQPSRYKRWRDHIKIHMGYMCNARVLKLVIENKRGKQPPSYKSKWWYLYRASQWKSIWNILEKENQGIILPFPVGMSRLCRTIKNPLAISSSVTRMGVLANRLQHEHGYNNLLRVTSVHAVCAFAAVFMLSWQVHTLLTAALDFLTYLW